MTTSKALAAGLCVVWMGLGAVACGKPDAPAEKSGEHAGEAGGHQEGLLFPPARSRA